MCEILKQKDEYLQKVKEELKKDFIGIDNVIDQVIHAVRVWYLMPELMTRPIIINLWGLTGTGKTTLVRKFVSLLNMTDSFVEIQMDSSSCQSIQDYIERSDLQPETQSVLLLDEIQRFRTVDGSGNEILEKKGFHDIWMLLSDGKFQSSSEKKLQITQIIMNGLYFDSRPLSKDKQTDSESKPELLYKQCYSTAVYIKRLIKSPIAVDEIMKWSDERKMEALKIALKNTETFEGETYSKMLIFISGNLDEAYQMSTDINDADTDADIFHEFSKKINIVNIKSALAQRFKPEQIARFGNNHIIYPSLSKKTYQAIIVQNIVRFCDNIQKIHHIKVLVDHSVYQTIYENGVFPTQGVRPVLSTLSSIFENYLPIFLLKCFEQQVNGSPATVKIRYHDSQIIGEILDEVISIPVELTINKIKKGRTLSEVTLTSVHEAGHAIVYSVLCKVTPTQIRSSTSSDSINGFVGVHLMTLNKKYAFDVIMVALAGQSAEEIVFGDEYKSAGASSDIAYATRIAADYVRAYGFNGIQSNTVSEYAPSANGANTDFAKTNSIIEQLLVEAKTQAIDIINGNRAFFKQTVQTLINQGEISPTEFQTIAEAHGIQLINCSPEIKLIHDYDEKWLQWGNLT